MFADQIKTADQKAAYIFTFLLALIFWSDETREAFSIAHLRGLGPVVAALSLVLAASVAIAIASAILAILPRSRPGRTIFYWGAWPQAGERLAEARKAEDAEFLFAEYVQNTQTLASICKSKYRMVNLALRAILCAFAAYLILLVVGTAPA